MTDVTVNIQELRNYNGDALSYATPGAAGLDLYARDYYCIRPNQWALIYTGIAIGLPEDHVGMICPRSGLAAKHGITVLNGPGVLDEDYRGEVGVILFNSGSHAYEIKPGDRVAQLVILYRPKVKVEMVDSLSTTLRGTGGFGSTGV